MENPAKSPLLQKSAGGIAGERSIDYGWIFHMVPSNRGKPLSKLTDYDGSVAQISTWRTIEDHQETWWFNPFACD
jgi:hypothetical protein